MSFRIINIYVFNFIITQFYFKGYLLSYKGNIQFKFTIELRFLYLLIQVLNNSVHNIFVVLNLFTIYFVLIYQF